MVVTWHSCSQPMKAKDTWQLTNGHQALELTALQLCDPQLTLQAERGSGLNERENLFDCENRSGVCKDWHKASSFGRSCH